MAQQTAKLKKKQWFPIVAPAQFNSIVLGESLVYEPQAMIGRTLKQNLMILTNDPKRQNVSLEFKVVDVENNKGRTVVNGYEVMLSSLRRFVRRNSEKIDMSFTCETSDNVFLRVKPVIITRASVKGSVATKIRLHAASILSKTIKGMTYEQLLNELVQHKLQETLHKTLSKLYPLKTCEVRYLGIEQRDKPHEAKTEAKEEAKEALEEEPNEAEEEIKEQQ